QAGLAFGILLTFNTYTILLACSSLVFVAIYPFAKRFTWWPQLFLGLAFNWGALVGCPPPGRADDGRPPVSVFAYFLEKLLIGADQRYVLPSDLVAPLRQRVFENARQIPRLGVVASTGHEGGEVPLVNLKARACVEGTDGCLGPTVTLDDVPAPWQYDASTRAFANPLQLRRQRRVVSGSLFVTFAAAAGLSAVAASQRRSDWVDAFDACAAEPVIDDNCNTVTNRDLAQRDVTLLSGLSIGMGALAVGSGVTFAIPGRAVRQYQRTR
ncbi:MAG: UbiA family prenyltransferase, partial [Myxococcota bacterium]